MDPLLITVLVGLFYILVVAGVSFLRREGQSSQFAFEALGIIGLVLLLRAATGLTLDPIFLFVLLYLVTMRARLLTDLGNLLFGRRGYETAARLYWLALRLYPNSTSRYVVLVNWGIARLQSGDVQGAIAALKDVLALAEKQGGMGHKYEAACRYNLAVAHRKSGDDTQAVVQFNQVIDMFPDTVYGQAAQKALKKRRE